MSKNYVQFVHFATFYLQIETIMVASKFQVSGFQVSGFRVSSFKFWVSSFGFQVSSFRVVDEFNCQKGLKDARWVS